MLINFVPQQTDNLNQVFYPSGSIKEEQYLRNGIPANGWSRKEFYENGSIKFAESYSHNIIIEQIFLDESGAETAHRIYNLVQKKLIDKPPVTSFIRPNSVHGCGHMGFYFQHLPEISRFIGAAYDPDSLEKAYQDFIKAINENEELETDDGQFSWGITGKTMSFTIWFEKGDMYYQWVLGTCSKEAYARARIFMEDLT